MRRSSVRAALAILVLFKVPSAFAEPIAEWASPWLVTLNPKDSTGNTNLARGFGSGAQQDEEVTDVGFSFEQMPGTGAFAKVVGQASSSTISIEGNRGTTSVIFARTFRLQGSPAGWSVKMSGVLVGLLDTFNAELNPLASVTAAVRISPFLDPDTPLVEFARDETAFGNDASIAELFDKQVVLSDGLYILRGLLAISVVVNSSIFQSGRATADFFRPERGLIVFTVPTSLEVERSTIITSVYQSILHRSPTDDEFARALAYLQAGGTREGLRGRLAARFMPAL